VAAFFANGPYPDGACKSRRLAFFVRALADLVLSILQLIHSEGVVHSESDCTFRPSDDETCTEIEEFASSLPLYTNQRKSKRLQTRCQNTTQTMLSNVDYRSNDWFTAHHPRVLARVRQPPADSVENAVARQVNRFPCLASELYPNEERYGWGPTLKTILEGTRDPGSSLGALQGLEPILVQNIFDFAARKFASRVTRTIPASCVGLLRRRPHVVARFNESRGGSSRDMNGGFYNREPMPELPRTSRQQRQLHQQGYVAFATCAQRVTFPDPADRNVNMLPFVFGDKSSLPLELQCYHDLIEACPYKYAGDETGKVGYLTVHEGFVKAGQAQRREGLHIEAPGGLEDGTAAFSPAVEHSWGQGVFFEPDRYEGGIYMASNIANTSQVWDALVDKNVSGIVDKHGGCEHLRPLFGPGTKLQANQLIWMTDCTPHEALEQETDGYRQFFRVVTSRISHWFAQHSTPNPLVPIPDNVIVVNDNKFES